MANSKDWDDIWIERIRDSVRGLEYGIVQITVHNGKIVQIDRTERQRFEVAAPPTQSKNLKKKD